MEDTEKKEEHPGRQTRETVIEEVRKVSDTTYRVTIFANQRARGPGSPDLVLAGLKTDNYMRNPVVLWAHDGVGRTASGGIPIGRTLKLQRTRNKMVADFEFLPGDPFAERVRNAWDRGFLRAASVSWMPEKWEFVDDEDEEENSLLRRRRDLEADLLEWSIVPVPADPDALREAHSRMLEELLDPVIDSQPATDDEAPSDVAEKAPDAEAAPERTEEVSLEQVAEALASDNMDEALRDSVARVLEGMWPQWEKRLRGVVLSVLEERQAQERAREFLDRLRQFKEMVKGEQ